MRTHNTPRLCAGPQTAGTPIKFWNVASIGDDEGEITLYGDVVSRQPVDWWTGEPEPGLYIAPESFMEDLAAVKGKSNITIKINSCGGDLYTGIAIHNAIRGLTGHKVVVVEGIAASAASVIACAGDEVQVYPGSMVMIHGVAGLLYESRNPPGDPGRAFSVMWGFTPQRQDPALHRQRRARPLLDGTAVHGPRSHRNRRARW